MDHCVTEYLYDDEGNVLLIRFGDVLTEQAVVDLCNGAAWFIRTHGKCRGIMDLTRVAEFNLSTDFLIHKARINPFYGTQRVMVAKGDMVYGMLRMFQAYQGFETGDQPYVAHTMEEAYAILKLKAPEFQPIEVCTERPTS